MKILKNINRRSFVTLFVFSTFMIIAVTSILMFSLPYNNSVALIHTIIGFSLILIAFFHLKNNFRALKNHARMRAATQAPRNFALPVVIIITLVLAVLSYFRLPPMESVYKWGNMLRANGEQTKTNEYIYSIVDKSQQGNSGPTLAIDLRKGPYFNWPQYAIWVEDLEGNFIQPVFVTSKLATNNFVNKVTKVDSDIIFNSHVLLSGNVDLAKTFKSGVFPESKLERARPESLPVFLHKNMQSTTGQTLIPNGETAIADAYTGATMNQSFLLKSNLKSNLLSRFKIRLEINSSFDFNDFYSSNRFPDDPVYSGNGYSAQPSLVYEALIDLDTEQQFYPMYIVGRGHHSGRDGEIYHDLENITTAREIVDRIIIEVRR